METRRGQFPVLAWLCLACTLAFLQPLAVSSESASGSGSGDLTTQPQPTPPVEDGSVPLNFVFISSDSEILRTSGSLPAVDFALETVAASKILGKYRLTYSASLDSQCDRTQALDVFHEAVRGKEEGEEGFVQNIAIIGAGCSVATIPVAEVCHYYNLPMLSWSSVAAELSNRHKFRSNYRLAPSEKIHSPGLAALLQFYRWKQVAMLTQSESLFVETQKVVVGLLPEVDIIVREFGTYSDPLNTEDFFVKSRDMRVFVINMYANHARRILCEAYHEGMFYPKFLWITPGWYGDLWWEKHLPDGCSVAHMEAVLSHSLSAVQYPVFNESEVSSLGISTMQFRYEYGRRLYIAALMGSNITADITAPLAYDAVWTLAMALSVTQGKIERGEEGRCSGLEGALVPLDQFDYSNKKLGCLLRESLDNTFFLGISGNVTFDASGDRVGNTVRISQYQPGGCKCRRTSDNGHSEKRTTFYDGQTASP
jgi:gamma-aminobutyric acid type B receptor